MEEPDFESSTAESQEIKESLPEEKQLASAEKVEELAQGLDKVAGLPPNIFIRPMTNEEVKLAETPAAEIPVSELFFSIPLAARLSQGVINFKEVVLR